MTVRWAGLLPLCVGALLPCAALAQVVDAPAAASAVGAAADATVAEQSPEQAEAREAAAAAKDDDALQIRLSLPTESDRQAWKAPGLRVFVGYAYGWLHGLSGTPGGRGNNFAIRFGARLDDSWSLMGSFVYGSVSAAPSVAGTYGTPSSGLSGLRFMGTLDPTWHATENLQLSIGFGFAGLVEGRTGRLEPNPDQRPTLVSSYTFPQAYPPISSCSGVGAAALARAQWLWVLGPMLTTGATVQLDGQWTGCVQQVGQVEPDTARPITRRQWWPHAGWSLGWVFGWR